MKYNNSGTILWNMVTKLTEIGEEELADENPTSKVVKGISDGDGGLNASIDLVLGVRVLADGGLTSFICMAQWVSMTGLMATVRLCWHVFQHDPS